MDVLHAIWLRGDALALWGEDATLPVKSPSQAMRSARPHPFAVGASELVAACGGAPSQVMLALPSLTSAPCDSSDLVRLKPRPASTTPRRLLVWTVPAAVLTPAAALRFLTDDPGDALLDVRPAQSVTYFRALAAFATDLADRGRVVPTITPDGLARWRPYLRGPDAAFVAGATAALPPAARARVIDPDDMAGGDPAELTGAALAALTDAAFRALQPTQWSLADTMPARRGRRPAADRAIAAWLRALTQDPVIDAPEPDVERLRQQLSPWQRDATAAAGPARLVVRLREPPPREPGASPDPWHLDFALQSVADQSLIVEAAQVWAGASGLERWLSKPDQSLLAELARASAVYEPIAQALRAPAPTGLTLTDAQAYVFLTRDASGLDDAGVVVQLPGWWARRTTVSLAAHATESEPGGVTEGMLTAETLYNFSWRLALGDDTLTEEEMTALAQAKVPLVQLRGQWVAFDADRVNRGIALIREQGRDQRTARDILALALGLTPEGRDEVVVTADGSLGRLLDGTVADSLRLLDPPGWFAATLRPYQKRGLAWLSFLTRLGLGACLADDMGLGKTMQVLALEAVERDHRAADRRPSLVVCPVSLVGTWQREAARFAPDLRVIAHYGPERRHGDDLTALLPLVDLVVTTYQILVRDQDDLASHDWARVVVDEAQNVKNAQTQAAKAIRRLPAGQRVALTGTPVENKLAELRTILDFCNPGFLGTPETFRARFANPIEHHGDAETTERLRAITRPFILRRVKTDRSIIDDLPDRIDTKQTCFLMPEQASLYQAVVTDMMARISAADGIERRGLILATLMKLKQVCNHPAQFLHDGSPVGRRSGKIARLDEIVDEILSEDGRALIFTQFTEFGDILVRHLTTRFGGPVAYLTGQVPRRRRDEIIADFQSDDGPRLFVLSLKAGGTGLTLTAANHVIHVDRWWNPAVENQATDRAFRIGQRRNVQVHTFVTAGTLEERIDDMIERKKALADLVVGDGEGWLTELSTAELRDVFALSKEALGE